MRQPFHACQSLPVQSSLLPVRLISVLFFLALCLCVRVPYRCEPPVGATVKECASRWCSGGSELVSLKDVHRDPDVWRSKYLPSGDKLASVSRSARQIIYDGELARNLFLFFFSLSPILFPASFSCVYPSPKGNVVREVFSGETRTGSVRKTSGNLATLTRPLIRDAGGKKKKKKARMH